MRRAMLLVLTSSFVLSGEARSWGAAGHQTVGALADHLIAGTPAAARVRTILGVDLRTASVWADCAKGVSLEDGAFRYTVKARFRECRPFEDAAGQARMVDFVARNWAACQPAADEEPCHKQYHYTDVAIERDAYAGREVGTSDHDIVAAISASIRVLQGRSAPSPFSIKDKQEALLLLAHWVGDLHQPLHVGAIYLNPRGLPVDPDDGSFDPGSRTRGGNQLLDGGRVLHTEWDAIPGALHAARLGATGIAEARRIPATAGPPSRWPARWATETLRVSHDAFLGLNFGSENVAAHTWPATVPAGYDLKRVALQRRQLLAAGARLAEVAGILR